ncbi:MAG: transcription termination factor NusA [Candidatus Brocadiia bacterium]
MPGNPEILRLVESIHREKEVDREIVFAALESALASACKKRPGGPTSEIVVHIDRESGEIIAMDGDVRIKIEDLGRIAAQTAKQVLIQRVREAERDIVFDEYNGRINKMITGTVQRFDRGSLIVNLGKVEGVLPRSETVFNENFTPGDRVRAIILDIKKKGNKVVITLSRTSPLLVKELFLLEVPEISDRIIEIKDIVREAGLRTKIGVSSNDSKVDCVGACVGVRGNRINNIRNELNGERIDIIPWSPVAENFIVSAMSPAEVISVELDKIEKRARVLVRDDQLSLAIGKKGQNVRLAARLTRWHIDVITECQLADERGKMRDELLKLPSMTEDMLDRLQLAGILSIYDIAECDPEELAEISGLSPEIIQRMKEASEEAIKSLEVAGIAAASAADFEDVVTGAERKPAEPLPESNSDSVEPEN